MTKTILAYRKSGLAFLLMVLIAIFQVSCDLSGESNYTPQLTLVTYPRLQNGDSLTIRGIADSEDLLLDTIRVGDTVSFVLLLNGYTNNLKSFYINQSADSISKILLPEKLSMDSVFLTSSDYKVGKFLFRDKITALFFPFSFVAKGVTKTSKFSLHLVSDANFEMGVGGSNTTSVSIRTPIKAN